MRTVILLLVKNYQHLMASKAVQEQDEEKHVIHSECEVRASQNVGVLRPQLSFVRWMHTHSRLWRADYMPRFAGHRDAAFFMSARATRKIWEARPGHSPRGIPSGFLSYTARTCFFFSAPFALSPTLRSSRGRGTSVEPGSLDAFLAWPEHGICKSSRLLFKPHVKVAVARLLVLVIRGRFASLSLQVRSGIGRLSVRVEGLNLWPRELLLAGSGMSCFFLKRTIRLDFTSGGIASFS